MLYLKRLMARHTLSMQLYGREVLCVERDLRYDAFSFHPRLKIESIYLWLYSPLLDLGRFLVP
jgi:hypothetical protein